MTTNTTIDFEHIEKGTIFTNIQRHYLLLTLTLGSNNSEWFANKKFEAVNELAWHTIYNNPKLYNIGKQEVHDKIQELINE